MTTSINVNRTMTATDTPTDTETVCEDDDAPDADDRCVVLATNKRTQLTKFKY